MATIDKGAKALDVKSINASINLLDKAIDAKALQKLGTDMKKYEDITKKTGNIKKNLQKFSDAIGDLSGIDANSAEALSNLSNAIGGLSDPEEIKAFAKGVKEIDKISGKISELTNVEALSSIGDLGASMDSFGDMKKIKAFKKGIDEVFQISGKIARVVGAGAGKMREETIIDPVGNKKTIKSRGEGTLKDLATSIDSISNEGKIKRFKKGVNALTAAYGQISTLSKATGSSISHLAEGMTVMSDLRKIAKFKLGVTALTFLIHDIAELEEVGTTAISNLASAMTNISSPKLIVKFTLGLKVLNKLVQEDLIELSAMGKHGMRALADMAEAMTNISNPIMVAKFALGIKAINMLVMGDVKKINEMNKDGEGLTALSQSMAAIANVKRIVLFNWGIKMIARNIDFLERIGEAGAGNELNKIAMSMGAISNPWMVMKFKLGVKLISMSADTLRKVDDSLKTTKAGEKGGLTQLSEMIKNYSSAKRILKFVWGVKRISKIIPQIESLADVKWKGMDKLVEYTHPITVLGLSKFSKVMRTMSGGGVLNVFDSPAKSKKRMLAFVENIEILSRAVPSLTQISTEVDPKRLKQLTKIIKNLGTEGMIDKTNTFIRQIVKLGQPEVVEAMKNMSGNNGGLKHLTKLIKKFPGPIRMTLFINSLNRLYKHKDKLAELSSQGVDIYRLAAGPLERAARLAGSGIAKATGGVFGVAGGVANSILQAGATVTGGIGGGVASGGLRGLGSLGGGLARMFGGVAGGLGTAASGAFRGAGTFGSGAARGLGTAASGAAGAGGGIAQALLMLGGQSKVGEDLGSTIRESLGFGKKKAGSREDVMDDLGRANKASSEGRTRRQLNRIERNTNQIKRKLGVKINATATSGDSDSTSVGAATGTTSKEGVGFGVGMMLNTVAAGIGVWLAKEHPLLGRAVKYFTTFAHWVKKAFSGINLLAKGGATIAKLSTKAMLKPLLKIGGAFLKRIPVIGAAASLTFAISKFIDGDMMGGFLELASGAANLGNLVVPGAGSLLSGLIDAYILVRGDPTKTKPEKKPPQQRQQLKLPSGKNLLETNFGAEDIQAAVMEGYSDEQIILKARQKYAMSGNSDAKIKELQEMLKQSHNQIRSDINNQGNKKTEVISTNNPKAAFSLATASYR